MLQITVGLFLHLDGIIDSEGANGTSNCGGGSGGSILIKTVQFSGHGILTVNGGSGHGNGGGGAGGRVAVHVAWLREYSGKYTAYGGLGEWNCLRLFNDLIAYEIFSTVSYSVAVCRML